MSLLNEYVGGVTWGFMGRRGTWTTEAAEASMGLMKSVTGANWTAIAFSAIQATPQSTEIPYWEKPTVTDEEVVWAIRKAKELTLKVCLKPIVNCADGTWRAHINFFDKDVPCEPKWSEWFRSYTDFILHYAAIAEESGCEMFCIGCELVQTDLREAEWRALIAEVRKVYHGIITYNCDKYQEDNVTWWDDLDVISSSGYYPEQDWEAQLDRIEAVVKLHNKPFFFMEVEFVPAVPGALLSPMTGRYRVNPAKKSNTGSTRRCSAAAKAVNGYGASCYGIGLHSSIRLKRRQTMMITACTGSRQQVSSKRIMAPESITNDGSGPEK